MDEQFWTSQPWTPWYADQSQKTGSAKPLAWHKYNIAYKQHANALQTLDVWIPTDSNDHASTDTPSRRKGTWIIYIHGGAWRDPDITAKSFSATAAHLLTDSSSALQQIGGLASLNYSLSPHPHHATNPSPPRDPTQPPDPSRMAKHPNHIQDVLTALIFLQRQAGFANDYILIGHSCGATLAFQTAMKSANWHHGSSAFQAPKVIIGLNGLYDLPALIHDPGPKHQSLAPIYEAFTRLAFGDDEAEWVGVSPVAEKDWARDWPVGGRVVLAQSREDSLVPYRQTEMMLERLRASAAEQLRIEECEIGGDHNDVWMQGEGLAKIVKRILVR